MNKEKKDIKKFAQKWQNMSTENRTDCLFYYVEKRLRPIMDNVFLTHVLTHYTEEFKSQLEKSIEYKNINLCYKKIRFLMDIIEDKKNKDKLNDYRIQYVQMDRAVFNFKKIKCLLPHWSLSVIMDYYKKLPKTERKVFDESIEIFEAKKEMILLNNHLLEIKNKPRVRI